MHPSRLIAAGIALLVLAGIGWWRAGVPDAASARPRPCLTASPGVIDFGAMPVDGLWLRRVEVHNCGAAPLWVEEPTFEGPFLRVGHAEGPIVEPGETRVFTVGFAPDTPGPHRGAVVVASDGIVPITVPLRGEGVIGDACPPLVTGLDVGATPAAARGTLCAPLDSPALLDGAGLRVEPMITRTGGPSI
ncbi:MAG: hypothetical protein R3F65_09635 [bacterium]